MCHIAIDLAWGNHNRTGLAALDADGRLVRSASVGTDDETAAFVGRLGYGPNHPGGGREN